MVAEAREFDEARAMTHRELRHLERHGHAVPTALELGLMVEVPSILWQLEDVLARVDFLMEPGKSGRIYLNEINTLPGFTAISMYPKLWAASGLAYPDLIERLIRLGLERHEEKKRNQYSR